MGADSAAGFGGTPATDVIYWFMNLREYDEELDSDWILAIHAIYERQNKRPLLDLLVSDRKLSSLARFFLADLIDRQTFKKVRKPTPIYQPPSGEYDALINITRVRTLRETSARRGALISVEDAVEQLARGSAAGRDKIAGDYRRKHNWLREFRERVTRRELRHFQRKPKKR